MEQATAYGENEVIVEVTFKCLCRLWESRMNPNDMKYRSVNKSFNIPRETIVLLCIASRVGSMEFPNTINQSIENKSDNRFNNNPR